MKSKLGIILYRDAQPMDIIGPWEVFATWKNSLNAPLDMYLVSETGESIACVNGITLNTHYDFSHCPQLDYLIIPGGPGRIAEASNPLLLEFIRQQAKSCKHILSVCTGAFILVNAGVLQDEFITTYWRALPELLALKNVRVKEERIVKSGKFYTSGGISSGIDLALEVIADVAGRDVAGKVQLLFEYFPEGKMFASLSSVVELPPYGHNSEPPHLAEYIKGYIK